MAIRTHNSIKILSNKQLVKIQLFDLNSTRTNEIWQITRWIKTCQSSDSKQQTSGVHNANQNA